LGLSQNFDAVLQTNTLGVRQGRVKDFEATLSTDDAWQGDRYAIFWGLLPTEWVNSGVFLQVEANFKGFLVNRMALSSQARCAHTSNW
jgi:hypothetical protein